MSADPVPSGHRESASAYAAVGGDDGELAAHAAEVRRSRLELHPVAEGARFWLDTDPSGALLAVTEADGVDVAVPGFLGRSVSELVPTGFVRDPESVWRSCLEAETVWRFETPTTQVRARLVDLAHAAHAIVRDRPAPLRLTLLATSLQVVPAPSAGPGPLGGPRGSLRPQPGEDGSPATTMLTANVGQVETRTSARTGRAFVVLAVGAAGLGLDVCVAAESITGEQPYRDCWIEARGELTATFAGGAAGLEDRGGPSLADEERLFDVAPPVPLRRLPGAREWPTPIPVVDLGQSAQVLAPLITGSGVTDAGVVAACVDFDGRWQLRRFPPGSATPDRVWDLSGHPQTTAVHRAGVAVLVGRELVVLDAELRLLHHAAIPGEGSVQVVAGPQAVHVVTADRATEADVPDEAGRTVLRAGGTVHRYAVHRLDLVSGGNAWQSVQLPFSVVYRGADPSAPIWYGATPADTDGAGLWFAVPGVDGWGRVVQHCVEMTPDGRLDLSMQGPPWTTARLRHGGQLLTADGGGPAVDGRPVERQGSAVTTRWLPGPVPAAVTTATDGSVTRVLECLPGGTMQLVAELTGSAFVSRADDPTTGRRWYVLANLTGSSVLGVVSDGGPLRPTHQLAGQPYLVDVRAGTAVLSHTMATSPVLDPRTGKLMPPGRFDPGVTYLLLSTLVRLGVER
jgi:hypothetical protein